MFFKLYTLFPSLFVNCLRIGMLFCFFYLHLEYVSVVFISSLLVELDLGYVKCHMFSLDIILSVTKSRLCFIYKLYIFKLNRMGSHKMYTRNLFQNLLIKTKFFHSYINLVIVYILVTLN